MLTLRTRVIRDKCGEDAVHYMYFQYNILLLLLTACGISMVCILPANVFFGDFFGHSFTSYGRYTITNLDTDNQILWLHIAIAVLFLFLTLYFMRKHTSKMNYKEDAQVKRTIFVTGIPKNTEEVDLKKYFELTYENCNVVEARKCSNVARLMKLNLERKKAKDSKQFFVDLQAREGTTAIINSNPYRELLCLGLPEEEAVSYYGRLEAELKDDIRKERERVDRKPLGMAFVTFHKKTIAARIMKDFNAVQCEGCHCQRKPGCSHLSGKLQTYKWKVCYAPDPQNIFWENLAVGGFLWWSRFAIINLILFAIIFSLTIPSIVVNNMDKIFSLLHDGEEYINNPLLTQVLPALLLWILSNILPYMVNYSSSLQAHWTRFLFLPDISSFFVNFVISCAFTGNALELLRIPGLLVYLIRLCLARSAAERRNVQKYQASEFEFGASYARMLCMFAVIMTYSIPSPLILPWGLVYMGIKHMVDRYNLFYAYVPTKLDKKVHHGAVNQGMTAPILCLLWILLFSIVHSGYQSPKSLFTLVVIITTSVMCLAHIFFGHFKYLSAHVYQIQDQDMNDLEGGPCAVDKSESREAAQLYMAEVLQELVLEESQDSALGRDASDDQRSSPLTTIGMDSATSQAAPPAVAHLLLPPLKPPLTAHVSTATEDCDIQAAAASRTWNRLCLATCCWYLLTGAFCQLPFSPAALSSSASYIMNFLQTVLLQLNSLKRI
ncbi:CSC1-like protein 2 [Aulostomus maculatus]